MGKRALTTPPFPWSHVAEFSTGQDVNGSSMSIVFMIDPVQAEYFNRKMCLRKMEAKIEIRVDITAGHS